MASPSRYVFAVPASDPGCTVYPPRPPPSVPKPFPNVDVVVSHVASVFVIFVSTLRCARPSSFPPFRFPSRDTRRAWMSVDGHLFSRRPVPLAWLPPTLPLHDARRPLSWTASSSNPSSSLDDPSVVFDPYASSRAQRAPFSRKLTRFRQATPTSPTKSLFGALRCKVRPHPPYPCQQLTTPHRTVRPRLRRLPHPNHCPQPHRPKRTHWRRRRARGSSSTRRRRARRSSRLL